MDKGVGRQGGRRGAVAGEGRGGGQHRCVDLKAPHLPVSTVSNPAKGSDDVPTWKTRLAKPWVSGLVLVS